MNVACQLSSGKMQRKHGKGSSVCRRATGDKSAILHTAPFLLVCWESQVYVLGVESCFWSPKWENSCSWLTWWCTKTRLISWWLRVLCLACWWACLRGSSSLRSLDLEVWYEGKRERKRACSTQRVAEWQRNLLVIPDLVPAVPLAPAGPSVWHGQRQKYGQ